MYDISKQDDTPARDIPVRGGGGSKGIQVGSGHDPHTRKKEVESPSKELSITGLVDNFRPKLNEIREGEQINNSSRYLHFENYFRCVLYMNYAYFYPE